MEKVEIFASPVNHRRRSGKGATDTLHRVQKRKQRLGILSLPGGGGLLSKPAIRKGFKWFKEGEGEIVHSQRQETR